jgi:hypothetical protein
MDIDKRAVSSPVSDEKPAPTTEAPTFWGSEAVAVVDVRVAAGYAGAMAAGMMRTGKAEGKS